MLENNALTVEDVCELLKLSRNTVYKLAREGDLPSYKVGRQLRFSGADVETVLAKRSATIPTAASGCVAACGDTNSLQQAIDTLTGDNGAPFSAAGEEAAILGLLSSHLKSQGCSPTTHIYNSFTALLSLYTGQLDAAVVSLYDFKTNSYNTPFAQRLCPGTPLVVIHLGKRRQGLFVQAGNPRRITTWGALAREDVRIAGRERGCSWRILMDQKLLGLEASIEEAESRMVECASNMAALSRVAQGTSDVCLGHRGEQALVKGVQFVPQQLESIDLVVRRTEQNRKTIRILRAITASDAFKSALARSEGLNVETCGFVLYQC